MGQTTHYNLPTWQSDTPIQFVSQMTQAMNDIDAGMFAAKTEAENANSEINSITEIGSGVNIVTSIGNYLSNYSPTLTYNNAVVRKIIIKDIIFLNMYGTIVVSYTGSPSATEINNYHLMNYTQLYNLFKLQRALDIYDICFGYYPISGGGYQQIYSNFQINSEQTRLVSYIQGLTPGSNNTITFRFQANIIAN